MGNSVTPIGSGVGGSGGNKTDPITRLTAARFDGPQALFTTAVAMLTERPALPDDLAGLVARLRDGEACGPAKCRVMDARSGCICAEAADAIEALVAENARLAAREPQRAVVKPLGWHNGGSVILRTEAEVRAEWMREVKAKIECLISAADDAGLQNRKDGLRDARDVILAAIPEARK